MVGNEMPWDEAFRITQQLVTDPSSHVGASVSGWEYPVTREAMVAMDLYDRFVQANFKKPTPYLRPWVLKTETRRRGNAAGRTPQEVREILADFGHPIPT